MRAALVLVVVLASVATACGGSGGEEAAPKVDLTPTFPQGTAPVADGPTTTVAASGRPGTTGRAAASTGPTTPGTDASTTSTLPAPPPEPGAAPTSASLSDRTGDLTVSVDPPPKYADLAGGTLTRSATGFELRVRLHGGAPATGQEDRTMNVASFYDVTGDGVIDYEVWLNLAAHGWGASYFDNTRPRANKFGDQSEVSVEVAAGEVVARFPLAHLRNADRFRWALASEWGRYEVIGTVAAARDDAPDGDAPAGFPQ